MVVRKTLNKKIELQLINFAFFFVLFTFSLFSLFQIFLLDYVLIDKISIVCVETSIDVFCNGIKFVITLFNAFRK